VKAPVRPKGQCGLCISLAQPDSEYCRKCELDLIAWTHCGWCQTDISDVTDVFVLTNCFNGKVKRFCSMTCVRDYAARSVPKQ
jgi:hypothetical protein